MNITYTDKFNNYHDKDEVCAIMDAVTQFDDRIDDHLDAKYLRSLNLIIGVEEGLKIKNPSYIRYLPSTDNVMKTPGTSPSDFIYVPAISEISKMLILFDIKDCVQNKLNNHYLGLLAHEIGHIFPQAYPCRKAFYCIIENCHKVIPGQPDYIPKFESNKGSYGEFVADYYACNWGFYDEITKLLKATNEKDDYIKVRKYYNNENEYRIQVYEYIYTKKIGINVDGNK